MKTFLLASFAGALLLTALAFASIENHFLRLQGFVDECPLTEALPVGSLSVVESKRQRTIQFFGIDPFDGPTATIKLFGPPLETRVVPGYPGLERIHGCACVKCWVSRKVVFHSESAKFNSRTSHPAY